jgi:membrane protein DedA with SNARE-associated domain
MALLDAGCNRSVVSCPRLGAAGWHLNCLGSRRDIEQVMSSGASNDVAQDATWTERLLVFVRDNPELAALTCFGLGFGESLVLVSLLVPSTVLFLGIGTAQSAAGGSFVTLWLAGALGAFVGDVLSYAIGRTFKADIVRLWPFTAYPDLIPRSEAMFQRWGGLSIIGSKFVGGLRPFVPVAAGMMAMPLPTFLVASAISCLAWAGIFLSPGFGLTLLIK